jgi:DNA-binding protein Fis
LEAAGGDKEKAALMLGISLATLYRKLADEDKEP